MKMFSNFKYSKNMYKSFKTPLLDAQKNHYE